MSDLTYEFQSEIWIYAGKGAWYFVTLPQDISAHIKTFAGQKAGFGSVRVNARIGKTCWQSSIFPDKKAKAYILPLKADIRKQEKLNGGDKVKVALGLDINPSS